MRLHFMPHFTTLLTLRIHISGSALFRTTKGITTKHWKIILAQWQRTKSGMMKKISRIAMETSAPYTELKNNTTARSNTRTWNSPSAKKKITRSKLRMLTSALADSTNDSKNSRKLFPIIVKRFNSARRQTKVQESSG